MYECWRYVETQQLRGETVFDSSLADVCLTLGLIADINCKQGQDEVTPLHLACRYNSRTATQFLLARAAGTHVMNYVVNIKDVKGRTPLHYATRRGHDMVIKVEHFALVGMKNVDTRPVGLV